MRTLGWRPWPSPTSSAPSPRQCLQLACKHRRAPACSLNKGARSRALFLPPSLSPSPSPCFSLALSPSRPLSLLLSRSRSRSPTSSAPTALWEGNPETTSLFLTHSPFRLPPSCRMRTHARTHTHTHMHTSSCFISPGHNFCFALPYHLLSLTLNPKP
jgi:hypothetical protein